ncbi:MAG: MFS transporter [Thermus sp.]|uniref:MFS transporter n=1 Tax=Thermus sp. TaxID=275 RepID=UPI0025F806D0|nr:MFS transporter [Thermus sp.]MCS6868125.1 MFS transporter [Thermus sp.]MCS7217374.1 MFS transporter [Thermus sp.]MDW8357497.1 MFS transporter [Thermus sp.]
MRHGPGWFLSLSAYWFATSLKWFLVLLVLLPAKVAEVSPPEEKATRLGFLFGLGAVMAILGPPIMGYLSDRLGRRRPFLLLGSLLTALALLLLAHAPSYGVLLLAYLLLQLADDLATGPYSALIPDLVPKGERGTASGYMGVLQVSGQVLGGVVGFLLPLYPQAYLAALVNLLGAFWSLKLVPERLPTRSERPFLKAMAAPWRDRDFLLVYLTRFLVMLGFYLAQTYLQYYLGDVVQTFQAWGRSLTEEPFQAVALLGLLISLGAGLSSVPAGRASDRLGRKPLIYLSGAGLGLLMPFLLLFPRYDLLLFLSLFFGLFYGVYLAVDWALVSDILKEPEAHATQMGLWQTSIVVPQVLAGAFGRPLDLLNAQAPGLGYLVLFGLAGGFFLLGAFLVAPIRRAR